MNRNRGYYRHHRKRVIERKLNILRYIWMQGEADKYYTNKRLGKLHKGKIHCSCEMCSMKSSVELPVRDKRALLDVKEQLQGWKGE